MFSTRSPRFEFLSFDKTYRPLHGEENSIPAHFSSKKSAQDELIKQRAPSSLLLPTFYPVDLLFPRDPRSIYNLPPRTFCASPRSRFKNQRVHALDAFARSDRISYDVIQCSKRSTFSQWHDKSPSNARFILSICWVQRCVPNFKPRTHWISRELVATFVRIRGD